MTESQGGTITQDRVAEKIKLSPPKMYKVLLLNDDFTSMDFVVSVLENIFNRTPSEAVRIMLSVHNAGRGLAGVYSKQIAETKVAQVHQKARAEGFPLMCEVEEVE
jgi:ATP-dependent Clp protease adaptor protein ClpS